MVKARGNTGKAEGTRKMAGTSRGRVQRAAAEVAKPALNLTTEKDGRKFAIDVLEAIQKRARADEGCTYPYPFPITKGEADEGKPYRTGPQWAAIQKAMFRVFKSGSEAAQLGFCSIMTEHLTSEGGASIDELRALESAGFLRPWGTEARGYPVRIVKAERKPSRAEQKRAQKRIDEYNTRPMPHHDCDILKPGVAEAIEAYIGNSGVERRVATAYLSKPFQHYADSCKKDKGAAEAIAAAHISLWAARSHYMEIAMFLDRAFHSTKAAVMARKDGTAILKKKAKEIARRELDELSAADADAVMVLGEGK